MANVEATKNALAAKEPVQSLASLINSSAKELGRALQDQMRGDRFARIALTNIRLNPKLLQCTPESFLGALFTAAALDLEPVAGRAYLIPFNNSRKKADGSWHKVLECQFVMGYKGVADLFYRHEKALMLNWGVVKEGDEFAYAYGTEAYLRHRPANTPNAATTGYWVMAELKGGSKPFKYMTAEECMAHGRDHSKTFDSKTKDFYGDSPWKTEPDAMCLKTVLIQLAKVLPLSVDVQRALQADETSREFRKGIENALDIPDTTNWKDKEPEESPTPPTISQTTGKEIGFGE